MNRNGFAKGIWYCFNKLLLGLTRRTFDRKNVTRKRKTNTVFIIKETKTHLHGNKNEIIK